MATLDVLQELRHRVGDFLEYRAIQKHRSKLGRAAAPRYTEYLRHCQRAFTGEATVPAALRPAVEEFARKNVGSFWTEESHRLASAMMQRIEGEERSGRNPWNELGQYAGDLSRTFPEIEALFRGPVGAFLTGSFRARFKVYFGTLYKSERVADVPAGSQLWHSDGGPGTCIILMVYLRDVTAEDGAIQCLPWPYSVQAYRHERQVYRERLATATRAGRAVDHEALRKIKCDYYEEQIVRAYAPYVEQPVGRAGLVVAFGNNVLHRGGFPAPGRTRCVCLFHCYPSDRPTPFERYRTHGIRKVESYPKDPAAEF